MAFSYRSPRSTREWARSASSLWARFREFNAAQVELRERWWLRTRPWEEDLLHWTPDGQLHGYVPPPIGRHGRSVTSSGWCPGTSRTR